VPLSTSLASCQADAALGIGSAVRIYCASLVIFSDSPYGVAPVL